MPPEQESLSGLLQSDQSPGDVGDQSWWDAIRNFRNRCVSNPAFREWSLRIPLIRRIARRQTQQLFDVISGFVYSQILQACVSLNIFEVLKDGAKPVHVIAAEIGLDCEASQRLLNAAASLNLTEKRDNDCFALGINGAVLAGDPGLIEMIRHHALLYDDLSDPLRLLKNNPDDTRLAALWSYSRREDTGDLESADVTAYSRLMTTTQQMIAAELLAVCAMNRFNRVLDLGGGEGECAIRLATSCPNTAFVVLDLPPVAARAENRIADAGLDDRISTAAGDMIAGPLPTGFDCMTLVRILHDHNDVVVRQILRNIRAALPDKGTLIIAEPMAGGAQPERVGDAYFGFYLLAMGQGRPRSSSEYRGLLKEAGFSRIKVQRPRNAALLRVMTALV